MSATNALRLVAVTAAKLERFAASAMRVEDRELYNAIAAELRTALAADEELPANHQEVVLECIHEAWCNAESGDPETQRTPDVAADIVDRLHRRYRVFTTCDRDNCDCFAGEPN